MRERTNEDRTVDVLAEVFETVHVELATVSRLEVTAAAAQVFDGSGVLSLYFVVKGRLLAGVEGEQVEVGEGDVLCVAKGRSHSLRAGNQETREKGRASEPCAGRPSDALRDGASGVICATCTLADPDKNPLLQVLPPSIVVSASQWGKSRWLESTLELLAREAASLQPGARVVVARVLELLLLQLVRTYISTDPDESQGWLRAFSDPQIGGALGLIHERPAEDFTVAGLAHAVGMSRSAFAAQFARLVGEPPLHYVARWRMLKAAQLLKDNKLTLSEVAATVGYDSEAAFSKAFKRWSGHSPGGYRRDRTSLTEVADDAIG